MLTFIQSIFQTLFDRESSEFANRFFWYIRNHEYITLLLPLTLIIILAVFFSRYLREQNETGRGNALDWIHGKKTLFSPRASSGRLTKSDILPMLGISLLYAAVAFYALGDSKAPQTAWVSSPEQSFITVDLGRIAELDKLRHFNGGLREDFRNGEYVVETSLDGVRWTKRPSMPHNSGDVFYWKDTPLWRETDDREPASFNYDSDTNARYIRITPNRHVLELKELAVYEKTPYGSVHMDAAGFSSDNNEAFVRLFDEQTLVPGRITYMNRMYFDEIYHGRTAYEHVHNIYPYEITHPPLGKLIISIGIRVFGMTPFGWRFMGALFGVLMLPFLYMLLKMIFNKTGLAACGTALFAFEFMHLTQTRIATIDGYAVFFIILMYLFMYRYITSGLEAPFRSTILPFALSGIAFGLGSASKWIGFYAAAGLLVLFLVYMISRIRHAVKTGFPYASFTVKTVAAGLFFFVLVPFTVYCLSYIPYVAAKDEPLTLANIINTMWNNSYADANSMYNYHSRGVLSADPHPYAAYWYQWLFNIRPILFYVDYYTISAFGGLAVRSAFASFNNPVVTLGGLAAILLTLSCFIKKKSLPTLFIVIGFASQLLPWLLVPRETYAYHYFPSVVFLIIAICYIFNNMLESCPVRGRKRMFFFTGLTGVVFVMFLPVLIGIPVPWWYATYFLRWIPFGVWPF
jgi:4-amino-4-deoxy-L-arabinose transferase-like glycosyltransferase